MNGCYLETAEDFETEIHFKWDFWDRKFFTHGEGAGGVCGVALNPYISICLIKWSNIWLLAKGICQVCPEILLIELLLK